MATRLTRKQNLASSGGAISSEEYRSRRDAIRKRLHNGILVLEGNTESERGELRGGFFQDPHFLYLSGCHTPGARLILTPDSSKLPFREVLVLPDHDAARILWTGPAMDASDSGVARTLGFAKVARRSQFEGILAKLLDQVQSIVCLPGSAVEQSLKQMYPLREFESAIDSLATFRMRKSAAEIACMREAIRITAEGQIRGWRSLQSSGNEYEVSADVTHEFLRLGAERHSFAPIVASGANACVLHYSRNRAELKGGDLTILDVGAERAGYAGDLTRTIPVGGRFSRRQQQLYEAVLEVQKEVIRNVRPGAYIARQVPGSLHQLVSSRFGEMRLGPKKKPLSEYFPHGTSHHLGMEVHDLCDVLAPLAPGMVITVEPGVYIPEEGIGIRIEDDVLVTEDGAEVLSSSLPKEIRDVEAILKR